MDVVDPAVAPRAAACGASGSFAAAGAVLGALGAVVGVDVSCLAGGGGAASSWASGLSPSFTVSTNGFFVSTARGLMNPRRPTERYGFERMSRGLR